MLTLATPLGLLGLTALALPLWLHLVRRPGRVVRVASLRFLPKDRVPLKAVRVRDPWLFLLRCVLIVTLVLLLSGLRWLPEEAPSGRWRVLHPRAALTVAEQKQWDDARREGLAEWPGAWPADRSAWSFLADLDRRVGPNSELVVFGPTDGGEALSLRPRLHNVRLRWVPTPAKPLAETAGASVERVALLVGPDRVEDARYVRAALDVVAKASSSRLQVVTESPSTVITLGAVALPPEWRPRRVFMDRGEGGAELPAMRSLRVAEHTYALVRRAPPAVGATALADSAGEPLLTVKAENGVERWTWAGRFHPEWTTWVTSPSFARLWRTWLLGDRAEPITDRAQVLSLGQLVPRFDVEAAGFAQPAPRDLRPPLWWLLFGLFVVERCAAWWLGRRTGREVVR